MRTKLFILMIIAFLSLSVSTLKAQYKVKPFERFAISANAGTLGVGVQVATPLCQYVSLRTGVMVMKYTYRYDYDDDLTYFEEIPVKLKANMVNGLLLADIFPFKNTPFHFTGGFYLGTSGIIDIIAQADMSTVAGNVYGEIEIGDVVVQLNKQGRGAATLKTRAFKPYLGIGIGNSIPKNKRLGFKFELGAMFHGTPKIRVTDGVVLEDNVANSDLNSVNKFLKYFNVYPVLNFQLNFRVR